MVSALAGFVKVRYLMDKAVIDNDLFRVHYRITTALFFVGCILVTASNLIGKPNDSFSGVTKDGAGDELTGWKCDG